MRTQERVGELTVEGPAAPRYTGESQVQLRCDCGRPALRTVRYLRSLKPGVTPMCRVCHCELRAGIFLDAHSKRQSVWRDLWETTGSLYSAASPQRPIAS